MLVPGRWSVQEGHDLAEAVEGRLDEAVEDLVVTIHRAARGSPVP